MNRDIRTFLTPSCRLLGLGEPTHQEPAFGRARNALLRDLVDAGFRSVALETDRIAALAVDDFVRHGTGTLDTATAEGFTHGFGELEPNRQLVSWLHAHNRELPPEQRVAFHGFDAPTENTTAPSPRPYLQHALDHLGETLDLAALTGPDERWSRTEAVLDAAASPGATPEAARLRLLADDLLNRLHERAPELIAASSPEAWLRARAHLTTGLGVLRYHAQAAVQGLELNERISRLLGSRDALMARNLLEIREIEAGRGPTLVFAHNAHLRRGPSAWSAGEMRTRWSGAGSILAPLLGEGYVFVAGSLGRSERIGLDDPALGTYEGSLQHAVRGWGLTAPATARGEARSLTEAAPEKGYFPLDDALPGEADVLLHLADPASVAAPDAS
ncbi:erythromycin esterase family protein [Kitasatospora sp. NPDC101183]|uniref:erythromycin esterase family protein n=1 Tax=Kitasatospora sp. NPDC101183 TaxID=3364100 RepID=UPI003823CAD5